MITAIKIIFMIALIALLSYPFITVKHKKLRRVFLASTLRYEAPHTRKNIFFVLLTLAEFGVMVLVFKLFDKLAAFIESIPFVGSLISNAVKSVSSQVDCVVLVIKMILINLVILYAFLILKALLKIFVLNPLFHIGNREKFSFSKLFANWKERRRNKLTKEEKKERKKKQKEEKDTDSSDAAEDEKEKVRKRRRIPDFVHTIFEDDDTNGAANPEEEETQVVDAEKEEETEK